MAVTFAFYRDSALTTPLTSNLFFAQKEDGTTGPVDQVVYLGSVQAGKVLEADSDPGVDPIVISVVDATPASGHPVTDVKLATSQGGLSSATPGADLTLAASINSGSINAQPVWVRVEDSTSAVGVSTELSISSNLLRERYSV